LTIETKGFRKFEQKSLQLQVKLAGHCQRHAGGGLSSEIIEVSAQAVTLNTTDASLGSAFSENQVKQLPLEAGNVPECFPCRPVSLIRVTARISIKTRTPEAEP